MIVVPVRLGGAPGLAGIRHIQGGAAVMEDAEVAEGKAALGARQGPASIVHALYHSNTFDESTLIFFLFHFTLILMISL